MVATERHGRVTDLVEASGQKSALGGLQPCLYSGFSQTRYLSGASAENGALSHLRSSSQFPSCSQRICAANISSELGVGSALGTRLTERTLARTPGAVCWISVTVPVTVQMRNLAIGGYRLWLGRRDFFSAGLPLVATGLHCGSSGRGFESHHPPQADPWDIFR